MSSATAWAVPELIKALAILSEIAIKRSACERHILEIGKKSHFWSSLKVYILITSFSKVFLTTERKLTGQ